MIFLYKGCNSFGANLGQVALNFGHQFAGDPLPSLCGMDCQPIDVATPAVKATDNRADDKSVLLRYEYNSRACHNGALDVVDGIRDADGRLSFPP